MKKIVALLLALTMVFALAACGGSAEKTETADKPEQATEQQPAQAEQPAPAAEQPVQTTERVLLCAEGNFYNPTDEDDENNYRYELYASSIPAFFAENGDQDSDEEWFEFSEEYMSESGSIEYETEISGTLYDAYSEEEAREKLQNEVDPYTYYTFGEIETLNGEGYTAYFLRGVSDRGDVSYWAIVCFDGEFISASIEFDASASLDPDMEEDDPDYGTDFDPEAYLKNAEEEFIAFLGSLSFERSASED